MGQPPLSVVECGHAIRILEWNQSPRVVREYSLTEHSYAKSRAGGCVYCGRSAHNTNRDGKHILRLEVHEWLIVKAAKKRKIRNGERKTVELPENYLLEDERRDQLTVAFQRSFELRVTGS
ncbi:hypothetical protein ANCDUO_12693, partial [Ancylostoma duodenale]